MKAQKTSFPSLLDSLSLYKEAILKSVYKEDMETADINFERLISVLEYHHRMENRLDSELEEAKKRYQLFRGLRGFHKSSKSGALFFRK